MLSIILGSLIFVLLIAIDEITHEPGDIFSSIVFFLFPLIAIGLILFYILTSFHNAGWTCLNFAANIFVFRVQIDYLLEKDISGFTLFVVCSFLWAINKMIIDKLGDKFTGKRKHIDRLDTLLQHARTSNSK